MIEKIGLLQCKNGKNDTILKTSLSPKLFIQHCQLGQRVGNRWVISEDELARFAEKPRPDGYPKGKPRS